MLLYAATILLGAFLLFQIQPLVGKLILPWFGGVASVWSACLLFFQLVLLLGYLYAYTVVRWLRPRAQAVLHIFLLGLSLALLHVVPNPGWKPSGNEDPFFMILGLLAASVGLPYLMVSTTGPLAQAWYAREFQVAFPYRLFAVSNLGSLLALLSYPLLMEPFLSTSHQAWFWSAAYGAFCLLCGVCSWRARKPVAPEAGNAGSESCGESPPSRFVRLLWVALAACPSALLISVTSHITQNVSPIPLFWVIPLGLYLLSFILTFDRPGWYRRGWALPLVAGALAALCCGLALFDESTPLTVFIPFFSGGLFVCCMFCHGELARRRPHSRYLTGYYLCISLGGALGGIFAGALAPRIFPAFFELPVAVVACGVLGLIVFRDARRLAWGAWAVLTATLAIVSWRIEHKLLTVAEFTGRNFYGMLRVLEVRDPVGPHSFRRLSNGSITHGLQFRSQYMTRTPTTYYGEKSGVGLTIQAARRSARRVGVIGLGAGTLAAYGAPGDYYRFYEINPLVVQVARREFTFLSECPARIELVLGDARLSLEREPSQQFDVLAVDAFSSDSIPVHLLTREAFELYFRHLRRDGVLAVHVSNRYLDLEPVVLLAAQTMGKEALAVESSGAAIGLYGARWVLLGSYPGVFAQSIIDRARPVHALPRRLRVWTDDYSNLLQILK